MIIYGNVDFIVIYWFCMCKRDGETSNHLVITLLYSQRAMEHDISLFEVAWVMPRGAVEPLASWLAKFSRHRNGVIGI